jgi:hypothetical protein
MEGHPMWYSYRPFTIQGLRMKRYLEGYFNKETVLLSQPHIYRTMAGNMVTLFTYQPQKRVIDWKDIERALESVFGEFQGSGTSGRNNNDNSGVVRVKVKMNIVELPSPLLNADILAQFVGQ